MNYLEDGKITIKTKYIVDIANKLKAGVDYPINEAYGYIANVFKYFDENLPFDRKKGWSKLYATRTAEQILTDGFNTGCTDVATVFVTVMRAAGYPTKYIETISRRWLEDYEGKDPVFRGHAFAEVLVNNEWILIDPDSRHICFDKDREFSMFVPFAEGLDPHYMDIFNFESMKKHYSSFRKEWQQKHPKP